MTDVAIISEEMIENSQNISNVRCQFCNSLILCKESGKFIKIDFKLPLMHQKQTKTATDELESEEYKEFWIIDDMFTFENIGFSNQVGNYKYLICADCEMGPVGYHDIETKKCYIALKRVKHEN
ncbi:unnamed protein product [Diamesa hyperborea]